MQTTGEEKAAPLSNTQSPTMFQRWWLAIRPRTLPAAVAGVLLGIGIALKISHYLPILPAFIILICALLLQILANLTNDVADFQKGVDTEDRLGPLRVTQAGLLSPRQMWNGIIIVILLAIACGIYLSWIGGLPVILIGALSIISAMLYTVGPFALEDLGLGDLFAFLFFGPVAVCGTVYILTGELPLLAWFGGTAIGTLTTAILVVNNVRDMQSDKQAGRINIPVKYGRKAGEWEYFAMLIIAYLIPLSARFTGLVSWEGLLPLITLPLAIRLGQRMRTMPIGRAFNRLLADTAQLLLVFSVLFAIGINL